MNKKGSIQDVAMIGAALLFLSIIILLGFKITTEFDTVIDNVDFLPDNAKDTTEQVKNFYPGVVDNTFLFIAVGLSIGAFILAALVRIHPIFIPIFWIALVFIIFITGAFSNIYQEMAANEQMAPLANQLTFTTHIMTFLPFIVGVVGHILMIVMYKSWQEARL